jgi:hypothetical protein
MKMGRRKETCGETSKFYLLLVNSLRPFFSAMLFAYMIFGKQ